MNLHDPVTSAGGYYKRIGFALEKLGITTFYDFLFHLPFRYDDLSVISPINRTQIGEMVTIQGTVTDVQNEYLKSGKKLQRATISDNTGTIDATWFNQPYITKLIKTGDTLALAGKIGFFARKKTIESPVYETITPNEKSLHTGRIVPIYPETRGISSKWLRKQVHILLSQNEFIDFLPPDMRVRYNFPSLIDALQQIHFPSSLEKATKARQRLAFDELLITHLSGLKRKKDWVENLTTQAFILQSFQKDIDAFIAKLPFTLTLTQQKAVSEIFLDLQKGKPMNRLLEGDVGSGKTVVATIAAFLTHLNGFQSVFMAPTEILANQHYNTISNLLSPLGVKIGLATSSSKYYVLSSMHKDKKETHNTKYILHNTDILVGTHALLSDKINFDNLGLVVIDEQQRFGVAQRGIIRKKGTNPHLLTMTATPIPRTIALTLYGDLDLSVLDELPKGRKNIKTWLVPGEKRNNAYEWIRKQILDTKGQAFIICPFIEESESMQTIKAAAKEFEHLQKNVFPDLKIGLLHGKLKAKEKDEILKSFKEKKFDILVATPVVEVGIDIPNATIMVIEASERFGLSQLHQLRGRVGRGDKQSYCLLFTQSNNPQTIKRLKAMETTHIGAQLAELDLKMRGPGDMYGTKQHGEVMLKIANFSDFELIETTKKEAENIFKNIEKYPNLQEKLKEKTMPAVSPD